MARKNSLREVKKLSSPKTQDVFAYSDYWEAWESHGDDENDSANWSFLADGSFEECLRGIQSLITIQLEYEIREEKNLPLRENPEWFLDELTKRHQSQVEIVKRECFQKGEYIAPGWSIRSMRNRHECEWIAKNGNPSL